MPNLPETPAPPAKRRPHGRSLEDFYLKGKDGKEKTGTARLHPAEWKLLEAARTGEFATIAKQRPEKATRGNRIRGSFLRFIALGGDDQNPLHEKGVQLLGAWITGECDLEGGHLTQDFIVAHSVFADVLILRGAVARTINLTGSECRAGLGGDRLETRGDVFLRNGFKAKGEVRLLGARIGGTLSCIGGHFENAGDDALSCDKLETSGSVSLGKGFKAQGSVRLLGARIAGNLDCAGGHFEHAGGVALFCDGLETKGDVFLRNGFKATGEVRLLGARIGGNLECGAGQFENAGGVALFCDGASVAGSFFFCKVETFEGILHCTKMRCGSLIDDRASWEKAGAKGYYLDGFDYASHIPSDRPSAESYVQWLSGDLDNKQRGCYPQPWKHLIAVLRRQGENRIASKIAFELNKKLCRSSGWRSPLHRLLWAGWGALAGFGYKPMRLLKIALGFWFTTALFFGWAADRGVFSPSNPLVFDNPRYALCRLEQAARVAPAEASTAEKERHQSAGNWTTCFSPAEYTTFSPWLYSLDLLLPLVDLGQEKDWAPQVTRPTEEAAKLARSAPLEQSIRTPVAQDWWTLGVVTRWLMWFEILFGWVVSLLFVAIVSGLARHEKEE